MVKRTSAAHEPTAAEERDEATSGAADLSAALNRRVLERIRPVLPAGALVFAGLTLFNAYGLSGAPFRWALILNLASLISTLAALVALRSNRVPLERAHAFAFGLLIAPMAKVVTMQYLLVDPGAVIYFDIFLLLIAVTMLDRRWGIASFLIVGTLAIGTLWHTVSDEAARNRHVVLVLVTAAISYALMSSRIRRERELCRAMQESRHHQARLEEALADMDRQVEVRTRELVESNRAMWQQIEERKRAETRSRELNEQLLHAQRLESIGRLAGSVAHDFNNVLAAIKTNLHVALLDLPNDVDREPLEDAQLAADRAVAITRKLLTFSRKQVFETRVFDLVSRVNDMSRMLKSLLGESIELMISTHVDRLLVDADPSQIEQVLLNLTVNARDAMPEGGRLVIDIDEETDGDRSTASVRVIDTGVGMDDDTLPYVFEPFFTTKPAAQGTGLGLSTSYGIVRQHGGTITVSSRPGEGTIFEMRLPVSTREESNAVPPSAPTMRVGRGELILLVEDEEDVRRAAERMLKRFGFRVVAAASGSEALAHYAELGPAIDVLLTDVVMAGMSGPELAAVLTAKRPSLPVIFVSGHVGDSNDWPETLDDPREKRVLLHKPFEHDELMRALRRAIKRIEPVEDDVASGGPASA